VSPPAAPAEPQGKARVLKMATVCVHIGPVNTSGFYFEPFAYGKSPYA
jgi:hypothetical protein